MAALFTKQTKFYPIIRDKSGHKMDTFFPKNLILAPPIEERLTNMLLKFELIRMDRFREMMSQVPKKVVSRKTRLKFLLFIWQLSVLEVHISKNKRDFEN